MKKNIRFNPITNTSGMIVADFLFSFVMIIGIGIFIFGITFSLAVVEVSQYIVWSTARNYAAGSGDSDVAAQAARDKFKNLTAQFPLLTGNGSTSSAWFEMNETDLLVNDKLAETDPDLNSKLTGADKDNDHRQPWTGASAKINLKLFSSLQLPFLGKVAEDPSLFVFPVRAFIIRHPGINECHDFFYRGRFEAIKQLEGGQLAPDSVAPAFSVTNGFGEDNGC